ncbi:MAG TPA: hypothetical protein VFA26_18905 [Gemmataceae bacterium]|nr:hypothetical protein [Gemmataceae bacterium]
MFRRPAAMKLLALLALPAAAGSARAHDLEARCFVRPGWRLQVEGWYRPGGPAVNARARVYGGDDKVVSETRLDERGVGVLTFEKVEPLRVVVSAGGGHRKEVRVSREELGRHTLCLCAACLMPEPSPWLAAPLLVPVKAASTAQADGPIVAAAPSGGPEPLADHGEEFPMTRVLLGVGVLLGVAAAALGWRWLRGRTAQDPGTPLP